MSAELQLNPNELHKADVDIDTLFDMTLAKLRLTKREESLPSVEITIAKRQPKNLSPDLRRVVVGGALFEAGLAFEFWDALAEIQDRSSLRVVAE